MSKTIDEKVVEMQFDNKNFEHNIKNSILSLDNLKKALDFKNADKGFDALDSSIDQTETKFSVLETVVKTITFRITNSIMDMGKKMISAFTIDPIKTGFQEYETQINAVQTILANTQSKGTTLENVNNALDELNKYADMTIYNFTEMTRNIGTFTAAGVDLDTSVQAIKGIANLAAVSGSTSQQASTAMYQLSQALSSGTVKLQDWNSVVNAGMGGQVFQDALKETARVHGIAIDDMIDKEGSFRETLSKGWLSSEILTETLSKFTGDLNEEQLKSMGYTEEQISEIMKMGQTANDAATKVKTFTQLMDTLKEAAQSGWTQTWEILIGDFEEAKALFTSVSDTVSDILNKSAESRNNLLQGWKDHGGRQMLIEALSNSFDNLLKILAPIKKAWNDIFDNPIGAKNLVDITRRLRDLTKNFELTERQSSNLRSTFRGLFSIFKLAGKIVLSVVKGFASLFNAIMPAGNGILEITGALGRYITKIAEAETLTDGIGKAFEGLKSIVNPVIKIFNNFGEVVGKIFKKMSDMNIGDIMSKISDGYKKLFSVIKQSLSGTNGGFELDSVLNIFNAGMLGGILIGIKKFMGTLKSTFENGGGFISGIKEIKDSLIDCFGAIQERLKADILKKIAVSIGILAVSLFLLASIKPERMASALGAITGLFIELFASIAVFEKIMKGSGFESISKVTSAMIKLSAALLILSIAMKIMSSISWNGIGKGLVGIAVGLTAMVIAVNLLPENNVKKAASSMIKMSEALLILSIAMKIMSSMSWNGIGKGLVGVAGGLAAMVLAANFLPKDMASKSFGILLFADALLILSVAMKIMSTMSWDDIGRSLATLAGGLTIIVIAMKLMPSALLGAASLLIISSALVVLSVALKIMSSMSWEEIGKSLITLAGSLTIIAIAMSFMSGAIPGALALLVVSASLAVLTPVLLALGSMSWDSILRGLVMLAGTFAVIGIAAALLTPVIPAMLGLAVAITLLGVGCLAAGVGIMAFAVGFSMLSMSASTGAIALIEALNIVVVGILQLIPNIINELTNAIVAICDVIIQAAPAIGSTIKVLILTLLDVLVTCIPAIADGALKLLVGVMQALVAYTPQLVNLLMDFLITLLDSISSRIPELVDSLSNLILTIIKSLSSHVGEFISAATAILTDIIQGISDALGPLLEGLSSVLETVFNGISEVISSVGESIKNVLDGISNAITSVGDSINSVLEGISSVIDSIGGSIKNILDGIANVIESVGKSALNAGAGFEKLANGVKILTSLSVVDIIKTMTGVATGLAEITKEADGLSKVGEGMQQIAAATKLSADSFTMISIGVNNIITSLTVLSSFTDVIQSSMSSMVKSFSVGFSSINKVVTSSVKIIITTIRNYYTQFSSVGKYLVQGFANGITSNTFTAVSKAKAMAKAAYDAAKKELDVNSPSRKFMKLGMFTAKGYANGISDNSKEAMISSIKMATDTMDATRKVLEIHSPSRAFQRFGQLVGEGYAKGIRDTAWKAVEATYDAGNRLKKAAAQGLEYVKNFISEEESFDNISLAEKLYLWESLTQKYTEGSKERLEAEQEFYKLLKEYEQEDFDTKLKHADTEMKYGRMTLKESIDYLTKFRNQFDRYSEHYDSVNEELYNKKKEWMQNEVDYGRMTTEDQIKFNQELLKDEIEGSTRWNEIVKENYNLYNQLIDENYDKATKNIDDRIKKEKIGAKEQYEMYTELQKQYEVWSEKWLEIEEKRWDTWHSIASEALSDVDEYLKDMEYDAPWTTGLYLNLQSVKEEFNTQLKDGTLSDDDYKTYSHRIIDAEKAIRDRFKEYESEITDIEKNAVDERNRLEEDYNKKCEERNKQLEDDIKSLTDAYDEALKSRTKTLYDSYGLFDKIEKKQKVKASDLYKNLNDQVKAFEDWQVDINSLEARGLNKDLLKELRDMGVGSAAEIKAINSMTDDELNDYVYLWQKKYNLANSQAEFELIDMRNETRSQIKLLTRDAEEELELYRQEWILSLDKFNDEITKRTEEATKSFYHDVFGYAEKEETKFEKEFMEILWNTAEKDEWKYAPQNIVNTIANTIDENRDVAGKSMVSLASYMQKCFEDNWKIGSPSKVAKADGKFIIQGLVNGISETAPKAVSEMEDLTSSMISTMQYANNVISELVDSDLEYTPTIRPIMDLTNIQNGINTINDGLDTSSVLRSSMNVSGNLGNKDSYIAGDIMSSMSSSNGKVVGAINTLHGDVATLAEAIKDIKIYMDTGTLVGAIGPEMDNKLGQIASMKRRGI